MQATGKAVVNARQQRGIELAEKFNIRPMGKGVGKWIVPSATSSTTKYTVDLNSSSKRCTCPDWELRRCKCKHVFAVEYTIRKQTVTETNAQGETTVTETTQVTKKTTYRQNWPAYNTAQTQEKATFQLLLRDLCKAVPEMAREKGAGRNRLPLGDMIFSCAFKVYSTVSGRRFNGDLEDAYNKGYISKKPHYNSIFNYFEMPELTPLLHELIKRSSLPLKGVEVDFAVDSSGFSGSKFDKWFYEKYDSTQQGFVRQQHRTDWLRLHLMCGIKTNVVTSVEVSGRYEHDSPYLAPLVDATAQNFTMQEVSADKAYLSAKNMHTITKHKAVPYIPFKTNSTGEGHSKGNKVGTGDDLFLFMWRYYTFHTDQFLEHYHKRSNVESTFSMIKAKFGDALRSKTEVARTNEALCKVLCHNICCVIQSINELGIEADFQNNFCATSPSAQQLRPNC
ncbi:MAG: transposase [Abitibacteriaceae bacterium]|nr:transposase [Abditibacteriaceae bacterium]MBV9864256.1 transposase [Abditibacteriaceae bacterium]